MSINLDFGHNCVTLKLTTLNKHWIKANTLNKYWIEANNSKQPLDWKEVLSEILIREWAEL